MLLGIYNINQVHIRPVSHYIIIDVTACNHSLYFYFSPCTKYKIRYYRVSSRRWSYVTPRKIDKKLLTKKKNELLIWVVGTCTQSSSCL